MFQVADSILWSPPKCVSAKNGPLTRGEDWLFYTSIPDHECDGSESLSFLTMCTFAAWMAQPGCFPWRVPVFCLWMTVWERERGCLFLKMQSLCYFLKDKERGNRSQSATLKINSLIPDPSFYQNTHYLRRLPFTPPPFITLFTSSLFAPVCLLSFSHILPDWATCMGCLAFVWECDETVAWESVKDIHDFERTALTLRLNPYSVPGCFLLGSSWLFFLVLFLNLFSLRLRFFPVSPTVLHFLSQLLPHLRCSHSFPPSFSPLISPCPIKSHSLHLQSGIVCAACHVCFSSLSL